MFRFLSAALVGSVKTGASESWSGARAPPRPRSGRRVDWSCGSGAGPHRDRGRARRCRRRSSGECRAAARWRGSSIPGRRFRRHRRGCLWRGNRGARADEHGDPESGDRAEPSRRCRRRDSLLEAAGTESFLERGADGEACSLAVGIECGGGERIGRDPAPGFRRAAVELVDDLLLIFALACHRRSPTPDH